MITSLSGVVTALTGEVAVVEVGGVGLAVQCTPQTLAGLRVGAPARLATSLVVREDSLTLFGFADDDERLVFETLQGVSGIGPRIAQAVLAVHAPDALRTAIATEDVNALTLVPGIGKKGAQRLLLELKDSLGLPTGSATVVRLPGQLGPPAWKDQLRSALGGLGWTPREVEDAIVAVTPDAETAVAAGEQPDVAALLKASLRTLSRV